MRSIVLALVVLCMSVSLMAQNKADQTVDRAKQKAENRIDNKIDKGIDSALDSVEGWFKKKRKKKKKKNNEASDNQSNNGFGLGGLLGGKGDYREEYNFSGTFMMEMTVYENVKKDKKNVMNVEYFIADEETYVGMKINADGEDELSNAFSIIDVEKNAMVTLMEESKIGTAVHVDFEAAAESASDEETDMTQLSLKKTGRTKMILGHKCEEYTMTHEDQDMEMWVAPDIEYSLARAFGALSKMNKSAAAIPEDMPTGFMMEMTSIHKNGKEKMIMKVTALDLDAPSTKSTNGYQMLGGF